METWKDIIGFEGKYQISDKGNVKSLGRFIGKGKGYFVPEHFIKMQTDRYGYKIVCLSTTNRHRKTITVHKLVAIHFLDFTPDGVKQICHIDDNKTNNSSANLYVGSTLSNTIDKYKNKGTKLSIDDVLSIRNLLAQKIPQSKIAVMFNVRPSYISRINSGLRCQMINEQTKLFAA